MLNSWKIELSRVRNYLNKSVAIVNKSALWKKRCPQRKREKERVKKERKEGKEIRMTEQPMEEKLVPQNLQRKSYCCNKSMYANLLSIVRVISGVHLNVVNE